jgi:hypothetical protein
LQSYPVGLDRRNDKWHPLGTWQEINRTQISLPRVLRLVNEFRQEQRPKPLTLDPMIGARITIAVLTGASKTSKKNSLSSCGRERDG